MTISLFDKLILSLANESGLQMNLSILNSSMLAESTDGAILKNPWLCSITALIALLGLSGNIVTGLVFKSFYLKTSPTYVLLFVLCVADSMVILILTIETLTFGSIDAAYLNPTPIQCKFYRFFWYFSLQFSSAMTATLAIHRYYTLKCHHLIRDRIFLVRQAWIISLIIVLTLIIINIHFFFTIGATRFLFGLSSCVYITNNMKLTHLAVTISHMMFYLLIPYSLTGLFNILLARYIRSRRQFTQRHTTMFLIVLTFVFVILTLPYFAHSIYTFYSPQFDQSGFNTFAIIADATKLLLLVNSSLNFPLNLGRSKFRAILVGKFGKCCDLEESIESEDAEKCSTTTRSLLT